MGTQTIRIRRVGSISMGIMLVAYGILFLLTSFVKELDLMLILRFWPIVLIILGIEILFSTRQKSYQVISQEGKVQEEVKVKYDFPSIIMVFMITGFSIIMAMIEYCWRMGIAHISI